MKARDLKPGDTVDGWTAARVQSGMECEWLIVDEGVDTWGQHTTTSNLAPGEPIVFLTLERRLVLEGHDVNGEELWWAETHGAALAGEVTKTETRRDWFRADAEVTP